MQTELTINGIVHAAVRRDLQRLESALTEVADKDRDRAGDLQRAFANLRRELTHHHEGEDELIWPMLEKFGADTELLATMESEHQAMAAALADTGTALDAFAASGSANDAAAARESVTRTQAVVDQHLQHEEKDVEPLVVSRLETKEWKAVEKKLSRQPPRVAGRFFAWVQDGMTPETRAGLDAAVPRPVSFLLGRLLGRSYHREIAPVWQV